MKICYLIMEKPVGSDSPVVKIGMFAKYLLFTLSLQILYVNLHCSISVIE